MLFRSVLRNIKQLDGIAQAVLTREARAVIAERREILGRGEPLPETSVEDAVRERVAALQSRSLRPVINATGVILHTNLGRAPLADFEAIRGYSNLEYDLQKGRRGKRDIHTAELLQQLLRKPAIIVNNNAAAVFLVLNELACGGEAIVSRGELIEIGDGFRIPEIMARSGAIIREVGTTNRTRLEDYEQAISEKTRLILRVHPSNFHIVGFAERPKLEELVELGKRRSVPLYEDLGSGCLVDLRAKKIDEPLASNSLEAGVDVVSFSCDKLLGGPQSGIIAGTPEFVERARLNPMYRTFRADKLVIEALETTLRHLLLQNWNAIPTLRMIFAKPEEIQARATRVAEQLTEMHATVRESESPIGGGSTPDQAQQTWVIELPVASASKFEATLRGAKVPVIGRIEHDRIVLDMRTVADAEEHALISAVREAAAN